MARKAIYKHATPIDASAYPDDETSPVGTDEWNEAHDQAGMIGCTPTTATITIASGVATITDSIAVIAAESSTSDTLDKVAITNTNQYDLVYLFADSGDTITLTHTSSPSADGHVKTVSGQDETLSETSPIILIRKGAYWYGYGGGVVNAVSDIGDVTITSNSSGEILKWNGSAWINQTLAEAGVAASGAKLSDFAATSSSELAGAISDETGSGALAFATSPTLVTPALGTPASGVATNLSGTAASLTAGTVTTNANLTGDITSSGNATTIATDAVDIAMLSATGTASSSTFLRGDNSWQTAGSSNLVYIGEVKLGSSAEYIEQATGFDTYSNIMIFFNLRESSGTFIPMCQFYSNGSLQTGTSYGVSECINGGSASKTNAPNQIMLDGNTDDNNSCVGYMVLYTAENQAPSNYSSVQGQYHMGLGGTSNAPDVQVQFCAKYPAAIEGIRFTEMGSSALFNTNSAIKMFGVTTV